MTPLDIAELVKNAEKCAVLQAALGQRPTQRPKLSAAKASEPGPAVAPPTAAPAATASATTPMPGHGLSPPLLVAPGECDLMISYRVPETGVTGDRSVFEVERLLHARGYNVFVAERNIGPGDYWLDILQSAVDGCKAFIVLCSPTYADRTLSEWTVDELNMAKMRRKKIFPVWHSGEYPPPKAFLALHSLKPVPTAPGVDLAKGYVAANISHATVVEELAAALVRAGVLPSRAAQH